MMKQDWEVKTLGEVCEIFNGSTPLKSKKKYWDNGTINWFTINDIRSQGRIIKTTRQKITEQGFKKSSLKILPINSILLCCTASVGEFAITKVELTTNQQFNGLVIKSDDILVPKYLYYFSSTLREKLINNSSKTTIAFLSLTKLKNFKIPIPPLAEQKQIVAKLDECFAAIDKAHENTSKNLTNTKQLFQSQLNEIFTQKGKNWVEKKLIDICNEITDGSHFSPKSTGEGEFPYITVRDITNDLIDFKSCKFINNDDYNTLLKNGCKPFNGDILFSKDGTVGKVSLVDFDKDFVVLSSLAIIRPLRDVINSEFLKIILKSTQFLEDAIGKKTGAAIRRIVLRNLKQILVNFPESMNKQEKLVDSINRLYKQTQSIESNYQNQLKSLEDLKKSLLEKAFSGEL